MKKKIVDFTTSKLNLNPTKKQETKQIGNYMGSITLDIYHSGRGIRVTPSLYIDSPLSDEELQELRDFIVPSFPQVLDFLIELYKQTSE